jgi:hypothetical protein
MPSIGIGPALALGAGGSLLGGIIGASGAKSAASTQAGATQLGILTQINEFQNIAKLMQPYQGTGVSGVNQLARDIPGLTKPFNPTMADLQATPGYQFTLNQGEQAVANAYSGQGLGAGVTKGGTAMTPSGPGAKGAIQYAENLASTTFQQMFSNYLAQNSQIFNMEMGQATLGEGATAALGGVGQNMANTVSGLTSAGGAALAAGQMGSANALAQGITGATGGIQNFALLNALGGGSLFGGGAAAGTGST